MPIGNTAWYRGRQRIGAAGPVQFTQFDGVTLTWPFATAGLSVLRTRISADFWWWDDATEPRPGPFLEYDPVGVQVAFTEDMLGGPPAWLPTITEGNLDNRYKATVNEPAILGQVQPVNWGAADTFPIKWLTYASVRTETADSAAQRHFDSGTQIMMWNAVGPINDWIPDLSDSPTFAVSLTWAVLIGSHT